MNSFANMDGSASERTRALPAIMAAAKPPAKQPVVRVHYPHDSLLLNAVFDPDNRGDSAMWGWHALLEDLGYRVEYVRDATTAQVLPFSYVLAQKPAGPVVAGFGAGFFNEQGQVNMANPLGITPTGFDEKTTFRLGKVQRLPGGVEYLNFDLGTMYYRAKAAERRRLLGWMRKHVAL